MVSAGEPLLGIVFGLEDRNKVWRILSSLQLRKEWNHYYLNAYMYLCFFSGVYSSGLCHCAASVNSSERFRVRRPIIQAVTFQYRALQALSQRACFVTRGGGDGGMFGLVVTRLLLTKEIKGLRWWSYGLHWYHEFCWGSRNPKISITQWDRPVHMQSAQFLHKLRPPYIGIVTGQVRHFPCCLQTDEQAMIRTQIQTLQAG